MEAFKYILSFLIKSKIFFWRQISKTWGPRKLFSTGYSRFASRISVGIFPLIKASNNRKFLVMRFVFNSIILVHAHRRLPEFAGYKGRRYPGDEGPREAQILPRRLDLPQDFHEVTGLAGFFSLYCEKMAQVCII